MDYAEKYKFVLFTRCGVQNAIFLESWNAGGCCHATSSVNDTEFIKAMIRDPEWNLPEWTSVYAVGYSNGGTMAETLMCRNRIRNLQRIATHVMRFIARLMTRGCFIFMEVKMAMFGGEEIGSLGTHQL
ncbi:hypothetical protein FOL47_009034 [Perkinsus chesapeaki]|uniref:Uncharacterized protein n=1 Tax=Perkinsus chesapeaki TaxID=330153 RepID=A0A7J6LAQ5_PERCH|nr:hypothetical protein FOL47_009034 [Perkinsus chesapeaki]